MQGVDVPGGIYAHIAGIDIVRDYLDAAPVRGVRHGGGGESMEAAVMVAESVQQQQ